MITAIDFGCYAIRAAYRSPATSSQITLYSERAEYAMLPNQDSFREALSDRRIAHAECDDSIVVFGNRAGLVRWLSRRPCAPLFTDGGVPTKDAPARQILSVLTKALLPAVPPPGSLCCLTVPGGRERGSSAEFLSRIVTMLGFEPLVVSSAESVLLAAGAQTSFTGVAVVLGAETSEVSVCRHGVELAARTIAVGTNWIDTELAKQFRIQVWDEQGECYLDLESVRRWKHDQRIHLRNGVGERDKSLSRLYGSMLNQVATTVRDLLQAPQVKARIGNERLNVICAGGATQVGGFTSALTERFVDHDVAGDILSVRMVSDPSNAVVRGLLIHGELEQRRREPLKGAA
ncbi:MAG: hypothetical protein R3C59_05880 [Planctomycetaceae bacterium]